jgi:hypothetical protein
MSKRRDQLPSLEELGAEAKRRKHTFTEAQQGLAVFESLCLFDLPTKYLNQLSEEKKIYWLILHYGMIKTATIAAAVATVPPTLTGAQ